MCLATLFYSANINTKFVLVFNIFNQFGFDAEAKERIQAHSTKLHLIEHFWTHFQNFILLLYYKINKIDLMTSFVILCHHDNSILNVTF